MADDRGGVDADFENYVSFAQNIRSRLNNLGTPMGLSITLVSSQSPACWSSKCSACFIFGLRTKACIILVSQGLRYCQFGTLRRLVQHDDLRYTRRLGQQRDFAWIVCLRTHEPDRDQHSSGASMAEQYQS